MKRNNRGFTLIELLGVITIIGIVSVLSIVAVTRLIDKSRKEQLSSQKKTIQMAAESYLQANRSFLPKSIGDTTILKIKTLRETKYLKEDIYDSKGNPCMGDDSQVIVYEETTSKFKYDVRLYCGNEKAPEEEKKPGPSISVLYYSKDPNTGDDIDIRGNEDLLSKVSDPRYKITIKGCDNNSTSDECMIEGYTYSITVGGKEVFSSGTVSANKEKKIIIAGDNNSAGASGKLSDYIDIIGKNDVVIYVIARNAAGVVTEDISSMGRSSTIGGDKDKTNAVYQDKNDPVCDPHPNGEPGENEWISKATGEASRTISIGCKDDGESGCVRDSYTKTWLTSKYNEIETDTIKIKDNAKHEVNCPVRVNIDVVSPEVNITAYRKGVNTTNILKNSSSFNPSSKISKGEITINYSDYNELVSNTWMNKSNFPQGVEYNASISDGFIKGYTWEVNAPGQQNFNGSLSKNNTDGSSGNLSNCTKNSPCNVKVGFKGEGFRYGVLTITDKAGNKVVYKIYAKLDRTNPKNASVNNPNGSGWVNSSRNDYSLTLTASDDMSGLKKWRYRSSSSNNYTDYPNSGVSPFKTSSFVQEGINNFEFSVCDNADNCFESVKSTVKIDNTAPILMNVKGYYVNSDGSVNRNRVYDNSWVNTNSIYTEATGADDPLSGVDVYKYSVSGATTKGLTNGTSSGANFKVVNEGITTVNYIVCDKAGNCSSNVKYEVKLDRSSPICASISPKRTTWGKEDVAITINCTDKVSGCIETTKKRNYNSTILSDYVMIEDLAHNQTKCDYNVYLDKTVPDCKKITGAVGANTNWTSSDRSVTVECDDSHSGCVKPTYPRTHTTTTGQFTERIYDKVGNYKDCKYYVNVDKTKPECGTATGVSTNWRNSLPAITQPCIDRHSGCVQPSYIYDLEGSIKTYAQRIYDKVGNYNDCPLNIYYDNIPPDCGTATWNTKTKKVTVNCGDYGGSGCVQATYEAPFTSLNDLVEIKIKDKAGNEKVCGLEANKAILTYKNNGGSGCTSKTVEKGKTWGTLCTPTRSGYNFGGWYRKGTQVTKGTVATGNMTVKAKWYKKKFSIDIYYWAAGKDSNCKKNHKEDRFSGTRFNNKPHRVFTFKKYAITCNHDVKKMGKTYEYYVTDIKQTEPHNFDGDDTTGIFYANNDSGVAACKAGSNSFVTDVCYSENGSGNYDSHTHEDIGSGNKRTEFHGYWFFTKTAQEPFPTFKKGWYHSRGKKEIRYTKSNRNTEDTRKAAAKESCEIVKSYYID